MKQYAYIGILLAFLLSVSCNKDLKLPDLHTPKKIVLLGEVTAGDSVNIRGGQSVPVQKNTPLQFELIQNLSVSFSDASGTQTMTGYMDSFANTIFTVPYHSDYIAKAGNTYSFTASHPQLGTATASVSVPPAFSAHVQYAGTAALGYDSVYVFNVTINDVATENYYVIEAIKQPLYVDGSFYYDGQWLDMGTNKTLYDSLRNNQVSLETKYDTTNSNLNLRMYMYTSDYNTENLRESPSSTTFRRILLNNYYFKGQNYTTKVFVSKQLLYTADGSFYKGLIFLNVKSVSRDYFSYLKGYEGYNDGAGFSTLNVPAKLQGNVKNGMGIIGGVYKLPFVFMLDTWDF